LLTRARVENDRRAVALKLTGEGQSYVTVQNKTYRNMYQLMLERLAPEERDVFIAMITKIVYNDY